MTNKQVNLSRSFRLIATHVIAAGVLLLAAGVTLPNHTAAQNKQTLDSAVAAYDREDFEKALPALKKLADAGNAEAHYRLGMMYRFAWGVEKDYAAALKHFEVAAGMKHGEALSELGKMYKDGRGTERDPVRAAEIFNEAALQGVGIAQLNLARLYRSGKGVEKDPIRAWALFSLAIGNQYMDAMSHRNNLEDDMSEADRNAAKKLLEDYRKQIAANTKARQSQ